MPVFVIEDELNEFDEYQTAALLTDAQQRLQALNDCESKEYKAAEADRAACERLAKKNKWSISPKMTSPLLGVGGSIAATVQEGSPSPLILVKKSDPNSLRFTNAHDLKDGKSCLATFSGQHRDLGLGRLYVEQRRIGEWRYTEAAIGTIGSKQAVTIRMDSSGHIKLEDTSGSEELVFDVAFGNICEGNYVNFVGGPNRAATHCGGGRLWTVNYDGTISPRQDPDLVLGKGVNIDAHNLKGCWKCSCIPCGAAFFNICPRSSDSYIECGVLFFLFVIPVPYLKIRNRDQRNTFVNCGDPSDQAAFFDHNSINPGPFKKCLSGGRCKRR